MLISIVNVKVKPEYIGEFIRASEANASASRKEPGVARFDFLQQQEDPTRFIFIEAFRTPEAPAAHRETEHYKTWRDSVAHMMAEQRHSTKFINISPADIEY